MIKVPNVEVSDTTKMTRRTKAGNIKNIIVNLILCDKINFT